MDSRNQDSRIDRAHADDFLHRVMLEQNAQTSVADGVIVTQCVEHDAENCDRCNESKPADVSDCTCHLYCGNDSHSGREWHTHEGDPCPLHPNAPMIG